MHPVGKRSPPNFPVAFYFLEVTMLVRQCASDLIVVDQGVHPFALLPAHGLA